MTSNDELVPVTGATGTTGRRVADRLRALGVRVYEACAASAVWD
jgi:nucleoside-diphosphate-sugar epimerase